MGCEMDTNRDYKNVPIPPSSPVLPLITDDIQGKSGEQPETKSGTSWLGWGVNTVYKGVGALATRVGRVAGNTATMSLNMASEAAALGLKGLVQGAALAGKAAAMAAHVAAVAGSYLLNTEAGHTVTGALKEGLDIAGDIVNHGTHAFGDVMVTGAKIASKVVAEHKDEAVVSYVKDFTPQAIFGYASFSSMVMDSIEGLAKNDLQKLVATESAEVYLKHISHNLSKLSDERNLARLGVEMVNELGKLVKIVGELDQHATPEQMIEKLNGKESTLKDFKAQMDNKISKNMARLMTKDLDSLTTKGAGILSKSLWRHIKDAVKRFIRLIQKVVARRAVRKYAPPSWLVQGRKTDYGLGDNKVIDLLGLKNHVKAAENCSEVMMLYLFETLTNGMCNMAASAYISEKKGHGINVSGYADKDKAKNAFRDACSNFVGVLGSSKCSEGNVLFSFVETIGSFAVSKQGTGDSVFDVTTPAFKVLIPAWAAWLTEDPKKSPPHR